MAQRNSKKKGEDTSPANDGEGVGSEAEPVEVQAEVVSASGIEVGSKPEPTVILGTIISDGKSPSFFALTFRLNAERTTRPGRFVAVQCEDPQGNATLVLARVNDVHEVNPHEDAHSSNLRNVLPFGSKYASEGHSTVIYRIAQAEPLEEAVLDQEGRVVQIRSVENMPRAGAVVFEAGPEIAIGALGLEPNPDRGIHVGNAYGDSSIPIVLKREIVQRHIFIGGGIGSGKSYTRGVLAEELQAHGIPQINIDVNGEMIGATKELGGENLVPGVGGFTLPLSALSPSDVLDAVPSVNPGTNMYTLLQFAHESLLKQVITGKKEYFTVDDLVAHMDTCAQILKFTNTKGEPDARTVEPTKLRTASLNRLPFLGKPFDWESRLKPGAVINIDCRGSLISELRLIVAAVARDLQRLAKKGKIPFVAFSIDEFHLVAPNGEDTVTTQVLREIARIGRHYKLGLILTTQSPSDVDRAILKRLLTRFLHAIEPDQLDALRGVFSDASDDLVRSLPKLPQGACILTGAFETVRHATLVKIRRRATTHGGQTPDIYAELAKAGWTEKRYTVAPEGE